MIFTIFLYLSFGLNIELDITIIIVITTFYRKFCFVLFYFILFRTSPKQLFRTGDQEASVNIPHIADSSG